MKRLFRQKNKDIQFVVYMLIHFLLMDLSVCTGCSVCSYKKYDVFTVFGVRGVWTQQLMEHIQTDSFTFTRY